MDRRTLLAAAAAAPMVWPAASSTAQGPARAAAAAGAAPATPVTATIADWASGLRYATLPPDVVHAARRYVLDALGCAIAGWHSDKGRIAAETMLALGGKAETSVVGADARIAAPSAAFANAELMNALDYDAIPHVPPVTLPALLAVAERDRASGRALIVAVVAAHEVAARLSGASSQMGAALLDTGQTPSVFGINDEGIMAAAAGLANLRRLDAVRTAHAIGLAGYYCPPQGSHNWESFSPKTQVKYTPVGWICQGAVTAALLAERGFTSNPAVLDGPVGFPRFYGWEGWNAAAATRELGSAWRIVNVDFKPYAACRFTHSQVDCMRRIVERDGLRPEQIVRIRTLGVPFVANPDPANVRTQEDGQFSTPYVVALAAHGIPLDARAYDAGLLHDPAIRATIAKTEWGIHPDSNAAKRKDARTYIARVEVTTTDGRTLVADQLYAKGTGSVPESRLGDDELRAKFLDNARTRLSGARAEALLDRLWRLDEAGDVAALMAMTRR